MEFKSNLSFAKNLDQYDNLAPFKNDFLFPTGKNGEKKIYFCGNSLGLQPRKVQEAINYELSQWASLGVEGHFEGKMPWVDYHKFFKKPLSKLLGALEHEVVPMNSLTTNLHLMMVSFYRPTSTRFKIIMEGGAFPSDQYGIDSQVKWHGFSPEEAIIEIYPREGEKYLRTEDIIKKINETGSSLALVMFAGVNYYTGQFFDIQEITSASHKNGAFAGFDLAHAIGNLPLSLNKWDVDFAVWCSYKYLNSGPGGCSGIFVHENYSDNPEIPRLTGWWGHNDKERFLMNKTFKPMTGADGWQLSNAPILSLAAHKASLDIFDKAGIHRLHQKSILLTGYLEFLIQEFNQNHPDNIIDIITPKDRGCQLSLELTKNGKAVFDQLSERNFVLDWREPNAIRLAPVPLYNSFEEVFNFYEALCTILK